MNKPHPDAFLSSNHPERGYREWMLLEALPGGRMHTKVWRESIVPDDFFDQNRHAGQEQASLIGNTQDHRRLVARIPDALANQWAEDDKPLDDDERARKQRERLNSSEFSKLRVGGKRI